MKNILIIILIIALVGVGYVAIRKDTDQNGATDTDSATINQSNDAGSAKSKDLSNKSLKTIDQAVFSDTSLTSLNVSNNNLTGSLPGEIRKLQNLEELNASDNDMTGVPAEIGQLRKLTILNFSNNELSGLPLELGNLTQLRTLDLRGNPNISRYDVEQIQKQIPATQILTD